MSLLGGIWVDLRAKRLVALGAATLAVALIAVPLLLSRSAKPTAVTALPATGGQAPLPGVPVSSAGQTPAGGTLAGPARDPFTQLVRSAGGTTVGTAPALTGTVPGSGRVGAGAASSGGSRARTVAAGSEAVTPPIHTGAPTPTPSGLSPTQSYAVTVAITNPFGGLETISPLERLSVLPSPSRPLLVELGVLEGGKRVLFAVQPGAVVGGRGECIPGPIDCEVLSLAPGQTEALGQRTASGVTSVALFAVTGITVVDHPSVAAAQRARAAAFAAGRALLGRSSSPALRLFRYEPSVGAVLDLRNLTVSG